MQRTRMLFDPRNMTTAIAYIKLHKTSLFLVLISALLYGCFAYFLKREDFISLLLLYASLFLFYVKLIQFEKWNFPFLVVAGIVFRLVFLYAQPNLSQDFYRFIWDGELIKNGINPYLFTPDQLMAAGNVPIQNAQLLYQEMGSLSAKHYSNYPPVNQFIFAISAFLGMGSIFGSVLWMRMTILLADVGVLFLAKKLLQRHNLNPQNAFWYFLNPLVILELTGNLHFEGVMIFLFIWAIYLLDRRKLILAAPVYAASIMLKLVPFLFLPIFLKFLGWKKSMVFYLLVGFACLLYVLPFFHPDLAANYSKTIALWFSNFEFNAGIYNLVKSVGVAFFEAKPWELIASYGTLVKGITILCILAVAFFRKNASLPSIFTSMLIALSCYYFLSSTVHPWYLVFLLVLSLFTEYRFALLWSATVILSYYAYSQQDFTEHLGLLFLEYLCVFGYLGYEILKNNNILKRIRKKN